MMTEPVPDTLSAALAAYDAGLCVVRTAVDGTKKPLGEWKQYQSQRPDRSTVASWFRDGHPGLGVICGAVSDNLEMLELEGRFIDEIGGAAFTDAAVAAGLELLIRRVAAGLQVISPSGGRHFLYRCDGPVDGNTKLARRPSTADELAENADDRIKTLIETRGEGGFVVLAPSHGPVHPSGQPWRIRNGTFADIPTITPAERDQLFDVARSFDTAPTPPKPQPVAPSKRSSYPRHAGEIGDSWFDAVVDHLDHATTMQAELERYGWEFCYTDAHGRHLLRRPGKTQGVSGSINAAGRFLPFSTSVPFETGGRPPTTFDILDIITAYEHGGERQAAARAIADQTGIMERWQTEQHVAISDIPIVTTTVDKVTGEVHRQSSVNLPDSFWNERPSLQHIRQAAHSATRSADAVLIATLARVAALIPPSVVLPRIVGGRGSLNFLGGIIASSGAGKSTAVDVTRELLPSDRSDVLLDLPPGSGEGITELYFEMVPEEGPDGKTRKVKRQTKTGALMYLDEGEALARMGDRSGSTLMPTLRSAWSGQTIGQTNATVETHRVLKAHTYRLAVIVGFQIEYAANLIIDQTGGTPQRFVFAWALDPTIPDEQPDDPGPITIDLPDIVPTGTVIPFDEGVAAEIRKRALMASRGEYKPDPLDSHADLVRMKVAALLGVIDHRLEVNRADWELAGMVMETSRALRSWVLEQSAADASRTERSYAVKLANREQIIAQTNEERALVSGAKSIGRKVHRIGEECAKRDLTHAASSRSKLLVSVDDMLEYAIAQGWLEPVGERYKPGESVPV